MKSLRYIWVLLFWLIFQAELVKGQSGSSIPWDSLINHPWVDSVFNSMSFEERLGQLFMVDAYSDRSAKYEEQLIKYITDNHIGGILFLQGGPERQAILTNKLQEAAGKPLLIAADAEWGLAMKMDSTVKFPYQMTLGAIRDQSLIYLMGASIARQCRRLGIHINFAPVADVNNNPLNPVINFRSFGESREDVAHRSWQYAKGMQDYKVLSVAKHFPGHGDTETDSHLDLPVVSHNFSRLDSIELYPFKYCIEKGIGGVMIAHMKVPALDPSGTPTSLSGNVITGLLKDSLNFKGLSFTDALNMKGVASQYEPGDVEMHSIIAGNDILLLSEDVPLAIEKIKKAIESGKINSKIIDERSRKILALKKWAGLDRYNPVDLDSLYLDLHLPHDDLINEKLAESSITLLENKDIIPIQGLDTLKIATLSIGRLNESKFQKTLSNYTKVTPFNISKHASQADFDNLLIKLGNYDLVIAGLHSVALYPRDNFGIPESTLRFVSQLSKSGRAIIAIFGNPYLLESINTIEQAEGLLVAYQETDFSQIAAAEAIFGGIPVSGKLPVNIGEKYPAGTGLELENIIRFNYTLPENIGIETGSLNRIDSLANLAIRERATPGCQVLVAKDGNIIFRKCYGYHTYDSLRPVQYEDLYDLASVTKVSGALPCLMKLYEEGRFDLEASIGDYIPYFKKGNKKKITFREILAHQSGLVSWIPYWKKTVKKNGNFKRKTFSSDSTDEFNIYVIDGLYLHKDYKDKIYKTIRKSKVGNKHYLYSGLTFFLFPKIIENITGEEFEDYLYTNFYHPLGSYNLTFKPYEKVTLDRIVPTEFDSLFRKVQIHGTVHDEGAAMMDGKSSNAGLFSNSNDLAKLFQMYANYGEYGGRRYLNKETLKEFTRYQYPDNHNRRGLGFDKPSLNPENNGNTAKSASPLSFGHTGFTGTIAWVDPEHNLVYIFLSNCVYQTRENKKLLEMNIRTDILEVVYEAMQKSRAGS
ncbi:glycoside hydrolase family 3 N-terminal domain-containing protein [Bacteroidota bacterium]